MIFPFQPNFDYCQIYIFAILVPLIQIFSNFWWIFVPPSADPRVYKKWVWGQGIWGLWSYGPLWTFLRWSFGYCGDWVSEDIHTYTGWCRHASHATTIYKYQNTEIQRWKIQNMSAKTSTQIRFGTSRQSCNWRHVNTFVTSTFTWLKYPFVTSRWTYSHFFTPTSVVHVFD